MKYRLTLLILMFLLIGCFQNNPEKFTVYYVPIGVNYYGAPSVDYIISRGLKVTMESNAISELFKQLDTGRIQSRPPYMFDPRIIIIRDKDKKLIIVSHYKDIYSDKECYDIDKSLIDAALQDIIKQVKATYPQHEWAK